MFRICTVSACFNELSHWLGLQELDRRPELPTKLKSDSGISKSGFDFELVGLILFEKNIIYHPGELRSNTPGSNVKTPLKTFITWNSCVRIGLELNSVGRSPGASLDLLEAHKQKSRFQSVVRNRKQQRQLYGRILY